MLAELRRASHLLDWTQLALRLEYCPCCARRRLFVRLADDEVAVRCTVCRATPVMLSLVDVLRTVRPALADCHVYELSARGALVRYLRRACGRLTVSEFLPGVAPGGSREGVQCQDVQALTHDSCSFDVCTSTEVFEHVPDDRRGFAEIRRVLRPGGAFVFTVPMNPDGDTLERARLNADGDIEHLAEPEHHMDPIRREGILAFRSYGCDVLERLVGAGFARAELRRPTAPLWGRARVVVVAWRAPAPAPLQDPPPLRRVGG